jgi:amino acid adenylation domain-containing protein
MTDTTRAAGGFDEEMELLAHLLGDGEQSDAAIPRVPRSGALATSFAQELLWLLDRATPGLTAYNMTIARRLAGPLDVDALRRAFDVLVERHEALRTRFAAGEAHGAPVQIIDPPSPIAMNVVDLAALPADEREREAERVVSARARTAFDMAREPLFRVTLVRLGGQDHVLVLETHHIVMDGWSLGVLFRELGEAYVATKAGQLPALAPLSVQYADFAAWQRGRMAGERLDALLAFWRTQLEGALDPLDLPTDFPRPATPSFAGARHSVLLPPALRDAIDALTKRCGATQYVVLLAAYMTVLQRYSGRSTVLVGSGVAGRAEPELAGVVGYVNNTVIQRGDFEGDPTFAELLGRLRERVAAGLDHQDVPLERLALELRDADGRVRSAAPFDVVLTMQDAQATTLVLGDVRGTAFGVDAGATKFDLTLFAAERTDGLALTLAYRTDLFSAGYAERFLGHLRAVLEAAVADERVHVGEIVLPRMAEREALAAWNATQVDEGAPATLVELFAAQAARVRDRLAVVGPRPSATAAGSVAGTLPLTYAELDARSNQLARRLQALGAGANAPVGLLLDRSSDAIVGLLGILKAGAAYMPLSVDAPAARVAQQLTESRCTVVVTDAARAGVVPSSVQVVALDTEAASLGALPDSASDVRVSPSDLAYVLFTSGSTGVPKGVAVTHANAVHYARAISRVLAGVPRDAAGDGFAALATWRFGMASTLAADLGNTSLLPALLAGATLHVLGSEVTTDPSRFAEYVAVHPFDVLKITPNHLAALVAGKTGAELAAVLPRQWLVLGGEALRPQFARTLLEARAGRVLNHYGPTETTVGVLTHEVTPAALDAAAKLGAQTVPLGTPLGNTQAVVVDAYGNEQPVGIPGELWLGGAGVTQGYLNRPALTAERFTTFRGARVYRTGDRVRRLSDGTLEFLGRADDQVKVRGYRVELGEVEQVLRAHPGVAQGAVVLRTPDGAEPALVAYAVAKAAGYAVSHSDRPTSEKLLEWLAAQLPAYMVPSAVVLLEQLPLTANGKLDRAKLPAPDAVGAAQASAHVAPRTDTETKLAAIWSEVLKRESIGVSDNFLTLGGHSLLAIRVLGRISKTFGVRLPLRTLFDAPTIEQLAPRIDAERASTAAEAPSEGLVSRSRSAHRIGGPTSPGSGSGPTT